MQITLSAHAAELLLEAATRIPDRSPEEILEQALAETMERQIASTSADALWKALREVPGARLPRRRPPRFKPVQPLRIEGELPSERLIRERR